MPPSRCFISGGMTQADAGGVLHYDDSMDYAGASGVTEDACEERRDASQLPGSATSR